MIISIYIQRMFLYRFAAIFGITFVLTMFIELSAIVSQPNVTNDIITFIQYTFYKALIFNNNAIFFIIAISTMIFANHISNTIQLQIILLYHGNPIFILKKICSAISLVIFLYITVFHGLIYHRIMTFVNNYENDYIMKNNVPKIWLHNINVSNVDNIYGDIYLLRNAKIRKNGFIVDNIIHYTILNGSLAKYTKYTKTFITNTPSKNMIFFSLDKGNAIAHNIIPNVKIEDISSSFIQARKAISSQNIYSEIWKVIKQNKLPVQTVTMAYIYLINILQISISMFASSILVLVYLLNTSKNVTLGFTTIKVISYTIIIYTTMEVVKMIYPHSIANYATALALAFATILIFISKFIRKYY